jgi:hypothetical protein
MAFARWRPAEEATMGQSPQNETRKKRQIARVASWVEQNKHWLFEGIGTNGLGGLLVVAGAALGLTWLGVPQAPEKIPSPAVVSVPEGAPEIPVASVKGVAEYPIEEAPRCADVARRFLGKWPGEWEYTNERPDSGPVVSSIMCSFYCADDDTLKVDVQGVSPTRGPVHTYAVELRGDRVGYGEPSARTELALEGDDVLAGFAFRANNRDFARLRLQRALLPDEA